MASAAATLRELFRLARPPWGRVALAVLLGVCAVGAGVGLMATAGYLISRAAEHPPILSLTVAIVAVRAFGLARPILRYADRIVSHDVAMRTLTRIRTRTFERIEPLAPAGLQGFRDGDLLARMVGDVDAQQDLLLRGLIPPAVAAIGASLAVLAMWLFLPAAAAVLALGLLVGGVAVPAVTAAIGRSVGRRQAIAQAALASELLDLLRSAREVLAFGAEDRMLGRVRAADEELRRVARRDAVAAGGGEALALAVSGITVVGVLLVSVDAASNGVLDRVLVAALTLLAMASFEFVRPLPDAAQRLSTTLAAGRRVLSITGRTPEIADPDRPAAPPSPRSSATMEAVDFRYPDAGWSGLRDLRLHLAPGSRVALVGPSGSGKSTIAALLVRFLDPARGRVTLDGRDVSSYRQRDLRHAVVLAGQDAHLFSTSILENVRLARPDASDGVVEAALRAARIWDWVASLPNGWHTAVGEDGARLSGGQRQRVALARALLARGEIMVLDEPTAHLDPPTAEAFVRDIFEAADDRAVLMITHRPEALDAADELLELVDGRLVPGHLGGDHELV
jgi:thiol reductant ABC exporter CydC subunit